MSFTKVRGLKPPKSVFNLSYEKKFDFDMGQLIPVTCEEMVPGDLFKFGNEIVIRFQPLFAPILQEVNVYVHYFFVPTRLLWSDWEEFITGGEDGPTSDLSGPQLPRFNPPIGTSSGKYTYEQACGIYSLYDYFGFPLLTYENHESYPGQDTNVADSGYYFRPLSFPWRAYNLIWNEFYRDETLQDEVGLDQPLVLNRNWSKDYFTSALENQQRGVAPALPISGLLPVSDDGEQLFPILFGNSDIVPSENFQAYTSTNIIGQGHPTGDVQVRYLAPDNLDRAYVDLSGLRANLASAATIDVADIRLIYQVEKWMERNMRCGVRYTEFLHAHYGVSPRDDRLQRPEYLGGSKSPIIVSEVVQSSESSQQTTPTGRLYGKAITADRNYIGSYHAKEFGYLVGIMSVMPKPTYQQGVDRQWLRKSRWDFFSPEFSHLSEQEVTTEEVFAFPGITTDSTGRIDNAYKFGYQARYNEMRANKSKVCGSLRDILDYWHLGRKFDSVPQLNSDFITCDSTRDDLKRIFQVQNVPGMICNFANIITGIRPIPKFGEPGLVDHN